jgi:hypothetical protein
VNQSRRTLKAVNVVVIVPPDIHHFLPIFARWHLAVPTVAQDSLEASVERVEAHMDRKSHDDGLRIR